MSVRARVRLKPPPRDSGGLELGAALGREIWQWLHRVVCSEYQVAVLGGPTMPDFFEPVTWERDCVTIRMPDDLGIRDRTLLLQHWIELYASADTETLRALCELHGGTTYPSSFIADLHHDRVFVDGGLRDDSMWDAERLEAQREPLGASLRARVADQVATRRCECDVCRSMRRRLPRLDEPRSTSGSGALGKRTLAEVPELATLAGQARRALDAWIDEHWVRDPSGPAELAVLRDGLLEHGASLSPLDVAGLVTATIERAAPIAGLERPF